MAKVQVFLPEPPQEFKTETFRQINAAVKVENDGLNESWRFGTFRADIQPDGRR